MPYYSIQNTIFTEISLSSNPVLGFFLYLEKKKNNAFIFVVYTPSYAKG